jgi:hypothetical protein
VIFNVSGSFRECVRESIHVFALQKDTLALPHGETGKKIWVEKNKQIRLAAARKTLNIPRRRKIKIWKYIIIQVWKRKISKNIFLNLS